MIEFYKLKIKELWNYIKTEDRLFQLACLYLFFEYVRPQSIYPVIAVFPYSQILLVLMIIMTVARGRFVLVRSPVNWLLALFFIVVLMSSLFAMNPAHSFSSFPDALVWLVLYFLIISIVDNEKRHIFFMLTFLLWNFKMSQFSFRGWVRQGFGYSNWGTGGGPGWFQNSGEFGIEMCVFFPIALYFYFALRENWPKWKKALFLLLPFTAATGMISSSSRGALLGGAASLLLMLLKSKKKIVAIAIIVIVFGLGWFFVPEQQKARFGSAGEDRTSVTRIERWNKGLQMGRMFPFFGVGYDNWSVADAKYFQSGGGEPHNIFIECISELGYIGLLLYLALIFCTFAVNGKTRKIARESLGDNKYIVYMAHGLDCALVGYMVSGFFVTVFWYPYFWMNLAMTVSLCKVAVTSSRQHQNLPNGSGV